MEEVIGSIPIRSTNPFNNLDSASVQMLNVCLVRGQTVDQSVGDHSAILQCSGVSPGAWSHASENRGPDIDSRLRHA
jgi:hypothetical protein